MSDTVVPNEGVNWMVDRALGVGEELDHIALGTGTDGVSKSDTSLDDPFPDRVSLNGSEATVSRGSGTGELACDVTVTGGINVDPDIELTEIGLLTEDNRLVYREVQSSVLIEDGQRLTIQFSVDLAGNIQSGV